MASNPELCARALGPHLEVPVDALTHALARAHPSSVGRYKTELSEPQLADVLEEAGGLLRELGYSGVI
jgi:hypothetical protein